MSRLVVDRPRLLSGPGYSVAVAIPARNEGACIGACLRALDVAAANAAGEIVHVVLLVNNSTDCTADIARAYRANSLTMHVIDVTLSPEHAHAGGARRAAFDHALALLPSDGILMTTDADSCVDQDWISANLAELEAGADAVAGVVAFDALTQATLPLLPLRALEWTLAGLHARLAALIDPRAHDPWPNHIWAWGASLAVTGAAYRRVGGLPSVPLAEDRALAEALEMADLRIRHSHAPVVWTSARKDGRAPGGFADLLQCYQIDDAAPCDAELEPTAVLVRRLLWRARLRRITRTNGLPAAAEAARRLGYHGPVGDGFGRLWKAVERQATLLARQRVYPVTLETEVALAERLISRIERHATGPADSQAFALAE